MLTERCHKTEFLALKLCSALFSFP